MPLRRLFALSSLAFLAVLAVSPVKNALRPYRSIQAQYKALGLARATSMKAASVYADRQIAIQQIWIPKFDNRVDRCTTCHLGVSDTVMAGAPEPFRMHVATYHTPGDFPRFGCTACHAGEGLATSKDDAHGTSPDSSAPMRPAAYMESGCGRCHQSETVDEAPTLSYGRATMAKAGCYACHAVRGHEDFRSDAPPFVSIASKTGGAWVEQWLADPKKVDPNATMPNFQLSKDDITELANYLFSLPVPPQLEQAVEQASAEPAGNSANGKVLFRESMCITCHTVDGKGNGSAPELNHIATRATRGWLIAFIRNPHAFNPKTKMPQYSFSDQDVRDLVAYFEDELRDFDAPKEILDPLRVNQTLADKGHELFKNYGCFSCHVGTERGGERFGPDLDGIGDRRASSLDFGKRTDLPHTLDAWLAAKISAPRSFADGLKMPKFSFDPEQRRAIVTALLSMSSAPVPEPYRYIPPQQASVVPAGQVGEIVDRYRCLSCHQFGSRGGDISTAPLTFEGSKVNRDWLVSYLMLPTSIRPLLPERMPIMKISKPEAEKLADAIETFYVDPSIPENPFAGRPAADADPKEGERLYTTLGCRSCHIIGSSGGYYGPPLTDTHTRLKPGWVYSYLMNPQKWRADIRCPNYGLTDTDALRLTAYLETLVAAPAAPTATAEQRSAR